MNGIEVSGLDEVLKKLKKLPERIQKNVLSGAIRASAKPIIKEARRLVPVRTGTLKKSIGVVKRRSEDKNIIHYSVTPRSGKKQKYDGWYAHFVEFGTYAKLDHPPKSLPRGAKKRKRREDMVKKGEGSAPHPFMRPAYEIAGKESIKFVREYMKKRVDKEIAKL